MTLPSQDISNWRGGGGESGGGESGGGGSGGGEGGGRGREWRGLSPLVWKLDRKEPKAQAPHLLPRRERGLRQRSPLPR